VETVQVDLVEALELDQAQVDLVELVLEEANHLHKIV